MNRVAIVAGVSAMAVGVAVLSAQQTPAGQAAAGQAGQATQGRGRGAPTAPPPINWPSPALADGPIVVDTALVRPIKITVTKGLNQPWSMAFLPDGRVLVTERGGRLRIVKDGVLDPNPVEGLPPDIQAQGLAGLMDVQLHPKFAENKLVYITYHKKPAAAPGATAPPAGGRGGGPAGVITLARGRWDGTKLVDVKDIFSAIPSGNASRILFGRDGSLFMSVGYGDPPQADQGNPNAREHAAAGSDESRGQDAALERRRVGAA